MIIPCKFPIKSLLPILFSLNLFYTWSEEDEAKRIAQIKTDERRMYEMQTGQKLPAYQTSTSSEESRQSDYIEFPSQQKVTRPRHHSPPPSAAAGQSIIANQSNNIPSSSSSNIHWCFHCASPWHAISEPMQRVVRNLLEIRRAKYPSAEAITRDCVDPRDLDRLPRQICQGYGHCQTLVLTDHNAGSAFTLRGCAERFGAVDPEVLVRRKDNTCRRLHDQVDIQECICQTRKYCYSGRERSWASRYTPMEVWQGLLMDSELSSSFTGALTSGTSPSCTISTISSALLFLLALSLFLTL